MLWPKKLLNFSFYSLFFLVPLIFLPNTSELFEFNKMILTYIFTALIVGLWLIRMVAEKTIIFKKSLLDIPLLIFLITQFLSLLFSLDPRTSWLGYYSRFNGGLVSLISYALLYWAAVSNLDARSALNTIYSSLISAALVCSWGVLEHFGIDKSWWVQDVQTRVFSTLGQPNWLGAYIVALIFIPISWIAKNFQSEHAQPDPAKRSVRESSMRDWKFWIFPALTLLLFLTLVFTKSRSGFLAFAISSAVFWAYYLINILNPTNTTSSNRVVLPLVINIVFISLLLIFPNPLRDLITKTQTSSAISLTGPASPASGSTALETGGTESGAIRKIVWSGALAIWRSTSKTFWLGTGPETFAMAYYQYRPLAHNYTSEWELLYNKAHNEFLNYLSTTGILGLGSYLLLLVFMGLTFIKIIYLPFNKNHLNSKIEKFDHHIPNVNWHMLNIALFAGWLSISVTNFWGFSVVIMQIFLFVFPALSVALSSPPSSQNPPNRLLSKSLSAFQITGILVLLFSVSYSLFSIFKYWLADTKYASGQNYLRSFVATQNPQYLLGSYQSYTDAYQLNSQDPPITSDLSVAAAYLALIASQQDATASAQFAQMSVAASDIAVKASPYHPNYYKSRARSFIILSTLDSKYLDGADAALATAQTLSPTDPRILYNRGMIAEYKKNYPAAAKLFSLALQLKPDFPDPKTALDQIATLSAQAK